MRVPSADELLLTIRAELAGVKLTPAEAGKLFSYEFSYNNRVRNAPQQSLKLSREQD